MRTTLCATLAAGLLLAGAVRADDEAAVRAVVQLAVSEMDFDYERYARENFDRLHAIAGDDEFGRRFGRVEAAVDGRER